MATAALPIRELSADVKFAAATANKTFWDVVETKNRKQPFLQGIVDGFVHFLVHKLDRQLAKLVTGERQLIDRLEALSVADLTEDDYLRIADDIQGIVSLTNSLVEEAYAMPEVCLSAWRSNLQKIEEATSQIDSFVESFRMASDEACMALLADLSRQIA